MPNRPLLFRARTDITHLVVYVDGYPDYVHRISTRTGGEPLEDGREATDHAVAEPLTFEVAGSVSDIRGADRPEEAWQQILRVWRDTEPLRVLTEWADYLEMIITRCEARPVGRGMRFDMELREVLRVDAGEASPLPPDSLSGPAQDRSGERARGLVPLVGPEADTSSILEDLSRARAAIEAA